MGVTGKNKKEVTVLHPLDMQRLPALVLHGRPYSNPYGRTGNMATWRRQVVDSMATHHTRDALTTHLDQARRHKQEWNKKWRESIYKDALEARTCQHCGYHFESTQRRNEHVTNSDTCKARRPAMAVAP
jgi:hypothetical protein